MSRCKSLRCASRLGLSQKELAKMLKTSQQQVSRLEFPVYEGHSLSMLRRVAKVLHANVRVVFDPAKAANEAHVAEPAERYRTQPAKAKVSKGDV